MPDFTDNTTFTALILGLFIGYFFGKNFGGKSREERDYYRDEAAKNNLANLRTSGLENVQNALFRQRKIEAIKFFREDTNLGLKESKEAVEYLMRMGPGN